MSTKRSGGSGGRKKKLKPLPPPRLSEYELTKAIDDAIDSADKAAAEFVVGDSDGDFKPVTVFRPNQPDIRFIGRLLCSASHKTDGTEVYEQVDVYKLVSGKILVMQNLSDSSAYGGGDTFTVDYLNQLPERLGYSRLSKKIYAELGIDAAQDIE